MQIIIYDTEFTAWEGSAQRQWSEKWEARELIQFAGIKLNITSHTIDEIEILNTTIQPQQNPLLSDYIQKLTQLSQADIDKGLAPADFFEEMRLFSSHGKIPIVSWGNDILALQETAQINDLAIDWVRSFNLMEVFALLGHCTQLTSGNLYKQYGLTLSITEHNALDDTISLVESLKYLHHKHGLAIYEYFRKLNQTSSR